MKNINLEARYLIGERNGANIGCSFWNDGNVRQLAFLQFKKIANFTEFFFAFINVLNMKKVCLVTFIWNSKSCCFK